MNTIIFQTAWHFASASRLKCLHDDVQTDSDLISKINEIGISNRKPTNTPTNRIQSAFGVYFFKILQNTRTAETRAIVNIDMLFYMNNACMSLCTFKSNFLCTVFLIEVFILFTTKPCSIHTKCDWSLYIWFVFDTLISLRLKIQSLSLLWSSCENFRLLAEAKCHTVWKMIVIYFHVK